MLVSSKNTWKFLINYSTAC